VRQRVRVSSVFIPYWLAVMQLRSHLSPSSLRCWTSFSCFERSSTDTASAIFALQPPLRRNHFFFQMWTSSHPTSVSLKSHP
jgi:hypothetical protein